MEKSGEGHNEESRVGRGALLFELSAPFLEISVSGAGAGWIPWQNRQGHGAQTQKSGARRGRKRPAKVRLFPVSGLTHPCTHIFCTTHTK